MLIFDLASPAEVAAELGRRLRARRLTLLRSQQELAARAGVAIGTVRTLEGSGQSSVESLLRVVQALGLIGKLQALFDLPPQSIAQMAAAEPQRRQRAPRRRLPPPP